ncbi:DUF3231 family protein [Litchfieldia alkalitelluris]|uniref:DUF3231 family protein n=1 Tax=Litchfieldia alkalitelluris TaxID=304268 RepID=UPI001F2F4CDA|nr:DUF3231 family protein [Litchfieldia alkalitelluris]
MTNGNKPMFSTSEMAHLWNAYLNNTLGLCTLLHFKENAEDPEVRTVLEEAITISRNQVDKIKAFFKQENFPKPTGFTKLDVNLNAPRLYTDTFYLFYIQNMAKIGGNGYSLSLATCARKDIREFFTECVTNSANLFNKSSDVLLSKGLFLRPPQINLPNRVDFVTKQSFLTGWFGKNRPLTSIEIMNLYFNIERNQLGRSLLMGFSQCAKEAEVRAYVERGVKIAAKHIEVFSSILKESDLPTPMTWDTAPTESTQSPFSDKLMMFHITALTAASTSHYGTSLGSSPRRDIGLSYTRLTAEVTKYGEDGANIMIDRGWLEQPPSATDRMSLPRR